MKPIALITVGIYRVIKNSHRFRFRLQLTPRTEGFLYLWRSDYLNLISVRVLK